MKITYPSEPPKNFNEWAQFIFEQIKKLQGK